MNASSSPSQNGRRSRAGLLRRSFVWLLAIGLIAALIAGFRPRPIEVETAVVSSGPMSVFVLEEGKTRIRHRHTISPPVAGMLERIPLRAGEKIEAGKTVLATIHPAPSNFLDPRTMAEAEARVQAAQEAGDGVPLEASATPPPHNLRGKYIPAWGEVVPAVRDVGVCVGATVS